MGGWPWWETQGWVYSVPGREEQALGQARTVQEKMAKGGAKSTTPLEHPLVVPEGPWVYVHSFLRTG